MLSTTKKQKKTQASVPRKAQRSQDDVKATQTMIVFVCTNHTFLDCKKANKDRIELVTRDILSSGLRGSRVPMDWSDQTKVTRAYPSETF